jgi:hypothetical protein
MAIDGQFQDVNRLNYFTPRFAGLQIGVSYAPKLSISSTAAGGQALAAAGNGDVGTCGYNDPTTANGCLTNDYAWQDAVAVGANYLNKFGDFSVAAFVAYSYASFVPGYQPFASAANVATGANLTAWKQFAAGLQFSAYGFTLGGSYIWDNNGAGSNYYTGQNNDTNAFAIGLMYETGPWQLSVGAAIARNNNGNGSLTATNCATGSVTCTVTRPGTFATAFANPQTSQTALRFGAETASKIEVGANYALGPGVKMIGGLIFNNLSGPSNAVAGQSWAALLGMDFRF